MTPLAPSPYLAAARSIADDLVASALPAPAGVRWMGDDLAGDDEDTLEVVRGPVGPDLYGGTAGIGWFLGHLAASTGDARMAQVAADALRTSVDAATVDVGPASSSLFSGAAGVALTAFDVAGRLRRPGLRAAALTLARRIAAALPDHPASRAGTDLMGGLAGVLIALLAIHRRAPDRVLLKGCRLIGERLLACRHADGGGTSWPEPAAEPHPALCGLGHGTSGICWALAELAWTTKDAAIHAVVDEALRYERGWFSAERCAWADLRGSASSPDIGDWPAWTTAWCHGAIGIGAVRLRFYEQTRDPAALAEASAALQAARSAVTQANAGLRAAQLGDVTLCHGLGGVVDLLVLACEITGMPEHYRAARRAGDLCLSIRAANQGRWTVGLRGGEMVPGLFLGLAGIGVAMMRLHDPSLIPSPLLPGRQRGAGSRRHVIVEPMASRST